MRKRMLSLLLTAAVIASCAGCRTAPILSVSNAPIPLPPNTSLTVQDVAKAIWVAGVKLGWRTEEIRPGEITATLAEHGDHVAVVSITYDTSKFSIAYKDSKNLLKDGDMIHRRYNTWVHNLEVEIQGEAASLAASK